MALEHIIVSADPEVRNRSLDAWCRQRTGAELLAECELLDRLRKSSGNLYERVRALFFLYAIHRFHLPWKPGVAAAGHHIPARGVAHLLERRFEEALHAFLAVQSARGPSVPISSALAAAYQRLGFQTLADQVRRSVRAVRGNQWMFRTGHPADYPLRIRGELFRHNAGEPFPLLSEATPVRMDLSHSGWSDIFFLGMDFPEGARVMNVSIDLSVQGGGDGLGGDTPRPPVEGYFRVIDRPVLRLASVDLGATADITTLAEVFDFAKDYLGLLKAAVIASGTIPPGMEGATQPLADVLEQLTGRPGHGIELVSRVNGIPKGSRLAVSTNLLACLISVLMRATGQTRSITGGLEEDERRTVAARAILGEWLGGSGGGWQDSGGLWPGMKLIEGVTAAQGDPEFDISRGCLLPRHRVFDTAEITPQTRQRLESSLVLVHGGMAQDVGPILEMVTEKYLLRSEPEWAARRQAIGILDDIVGRLQSGDIRGIGEATHRNFMGPIQTIIPRASNFYTETVIRRVAAEFGADFWGFWMLGGMAGGGMGFLFHPDRKTAAQARLQAILSETRRELERAVPFAIEPVVYNFSINERGTWAALRRGPEALLPPGYYTLAVPALLRLKARELTEAQRAELDHFGQACRRLPALAGMMENLFDHMLPRGSGGGVEGDGGGPESLAALLRRYGFDRAQHEQIQADLRGGRIGLQQNRLPARSRIEDVHPGDVTDALGCTRYAQAGREALKQGRLAVVTLAGGAGSRWTRGAGVVKALDPFVRLAGAHRNFLEIHLAKTRRTIDHDGGGVALPHVITTSYLTHEPVAAWLARRDGTELSPGRSIGLRLVPTVRDLRFAWEEMPQQRLDQQQQKVRESLHASLMEWARQAGEAGDYTGNLPAQCLHPVGHWYEVPNLLRNGVLRSLLERHPRLTTLMVHNVDTLGANVAPGILGWHLDSGAALTTEVVARTIDDRGGGLARIDGRLRLVEGLALPDEQIEFDLSFYNSSTTWVEIDALLAVFGLRRADLADDAKVTAAVRNLAAQMPTYITLKDVKKRWGKGQEDVFPVAQFEKLWGDMTTLPDLNCRYLAVPRERGQQLKDPAQVDGWLRDGSAAYVESLGAW
jgi:hypothetical protein